MTAAGCGTVTARRHAERATSSAGVAMAGSSLSGFINDCTPMISMPRWHVSAVTTLPPTVSRMSAASRLDERDLHRSAAVATASHMHLDIEADDIDADDERPSRAAWEVAIVRRGA